jgi:hypothetical protein
VETATGAVFYGLLNQSFGCFVTFMLHAIPAQGVYFTDIFWLDQTKHFVFEFGHEILRVTKLSLPLLCR